MWTAKAPLAWLSPTKRDITLGFTYGRLFQDPNGPLKGTGKHARHLKLRTVAGTNEAALRDFIAQAVAHDAAR